MNYYIAAKKKSIYESSNATVHTARLVWQVTKGSFVDAENKTDGSSIRALKKNVVVMKPSEAVP